MSTEFPRVNIEGVSVSRLMIGTNWFLGFSHQSKAKDRLIREQMTSRRMADVIEVFLKAGIDTLYGIRPEPVIIDAVKDAEQRTGRGCITMAIPTFKTEDTAEARDENARILDTHAEMGVRICMPHQATTDAYVNRRTRSLAGIEPLLAMIRERGMVPGLSTHMPETPGYADRTGLDVATYIQIYNAAGFLMQVEVDWVNRIIWQAKKPVIVIKPMAAGRLHPLVGMAFVWATIRPQDMVCAGTNSPDEAAELIELSLSLLERRAPSMDLQATRSKASIG